MRAVIVVSVALALSACEPNYADDKCLRQKLFAECMKMLPAGPTATHYNHWGEVVEACDVASRNQSWKMVENIKRECR
jgi:hypothetical protein